MSKGGEISDEHVVSVLDFNIDDAIDEKFKKVFAEERKETFLERKIREIKGAVALRKMIQDIVCLSHSFFTISCICFT